MFDRIIFTELENGLSNQILNKVYQGTLIEHLVGQELLATQFKSLSALHFWVREKLLQVQRWTTVYLLKANSFR